MIRTSSTSVVIEEATVGRLVWIATHMLHQSLPSMEPSSWLKTSLVKLSVRCSMVARSGYGTIATSYSLYAYYVYAVYSRTN